jgi:hypothetical protein
MRTSSELPNHSFLQQPTEHRSDRYLVTFLRLTAWRTIGPRHETPAAGSIVVLILSTTAGKSSESLPKNSRSVQQKTRSWRQLRLSVRNRPLKCSQQAHRPINHKHHKDHVDGGNALWCYARIHSTSVKCSYSWIHAPFHKDSDLETLNFESRSHLQGA